MKEEIVEVNGKKIKATIRELTYGEVSNILQKCSETKVIGSVMTSDLNIFKLRSEITMLAVTLSEGKVGNLPAKIGRHLEDIALEESGLDDGSFREDTPVEEKRVGS